MGQPRDALRVHLADRLCLSVVRAQLECARSEAREALSTLRRLQRRVSELEEESRLQDADTSGASLQSELAHSQYQNADGHRDAPVSSKPSSHPAGLQTPPLFLFPRGPAPH